MYTAFYGLREKPFALSPDPRFLYLAASHREALAHLLYGIEQGEGFISVTGEVGTGKTTLCRTLLERLEGQIELAFLFNPSKSALELLQSICAEYGLPAEGLGRRSLMSQLNKFLLEQKERKRRVLLIIDEAQTLSENTLEQVRLLSNLETSREKLIQILLLGQPELDRKLDERGLRQLRQRISVRWKLEPLSADETVAYVRHRISVAAGEPKDLFTESALREVHRRTGGIPRLVNQLCDRALLAGYAARAAQIGPTLIRAAAREIPDVRDPGERDPRTGRALLRPWMKRPWMYFAMTLGFVGVALFAGLVLGRSQQAEGRPGRPGSTPAVSARADEATQTGVGASGDASNGRSPYVGRLIGYVDEDGRPIQALRASDEALVAAGLDPEAFPSGDGARGGAPGSFADSLMQALPGALPGNLPAALAGSVPGAHPIAGLGASASPVLPVAPAVSRSAVARGVLPQLLADRSSADALADSERAFLDLYDLAPSTSDPADADELQKRLEARGLQATAFDGGSLAMLRRLDHPVLIPVAVVPTPVPAIAVAESDRRWLALTGFDGDRVWLAGLVPGRVVSVALDELSPRWLEAGVIIWKNHEHLAARVERGAAESSIRWLQSALAELGYLTARPTGRFDPATSAALRDFQTANDIVEDGVVGPLTQIALYGKLDRYPVPRLSLASARPLPTDSPSVAAPPVASPPAVPGARG
ncbi:MAG: AAA family ATPase [Deltaproteobacteria bacterium]|nr:AAA family ATPase [Deltaproteobacteria bacterium]